MPVRTRRIARNRYRGVLRRTAACQPRPALGRRPWFALLRRARSLRRFAFAITSGSVPGGARYRTITLSHGAETFSPVLFAVTAWQRLRGLRPAPQGGGLLMRASSVHGRGMVEPLTIVSLDAVGTVLAVDRLEPRSRNRHPGAVWTLELPVSTKPPSVGARLEPWAVVYTEG